MIGIRENNLVSGFFTLTPRQTAQFEAMEALYKDWNAKINVLSRKDIDHIYSHHVLHSLAIARVVSFMPGTRIIDVGTGGGFPGIPLAVLFPEAEFHLVDSIGKKIRVVEAVCTELGLKNVKAEQCRAETLHSRYDFVVSRAVCEMKEFYGYVRNLIAPGGKHVVRNGILYLKGGDLTDELKPFSGRYTQYPIPNLYDFSASEELAEFYATKKVIHLC